MRLAGAVTAKQSSKKPSGSSKVTPEERAAMIALAEVLREIFISQQQTSEDQHPTLTGKRKLLLQ
jgi:hypothetical protein